MTVKKETTQTKHFTFEMTVACASLFSIASTTKKDKSCWYTYIVIERKTRMMKRRKKGSQSHSFIHSFIHFTWIVYFWYRINKHCIELRAHTHCALKLSAFQIFNKKNKNKKSDKIPPKSRYHDRIKIKTNKFIFGLMVFWHWKVLVLK